MPTTFTLRAETRSVTIATAPPSVFAFLSDPRNLPRWAPAFAPSIRQDAGRWLIPAGDGEAEVLVSASAREGTFDLSPAGDPSRGSRARVLRNGEGSELLFTLFFSREEREARVQRQMDTVGDELATVRELCEAGAPSVA